MLNFAELNPNLVAAPIAAVVFLLAAVAVTSWWSCALTSCVPRVRSAWISRASMRGSMPSVAALRVKRR